MAQVVLVDQRSVHRPRRERTGPRLGGGSIPKREGALICVYQWHHIREDRLAVERGLSIIVAFDVDTDDTKGRVVLVTSDEQRAT